MIQWFGKRLRLITFLRLLLWLLIAWQFSKLDSLVLLDKILFGTLNFFFNKTLQIFNAYVIILTFDSNWKFLQNLQKLEFARTEEKTMTFNSVVSLMYSDQRMGCILIFILLLENQWWSSVNLAFLLCRIGNKVTFKVIEFYLGPW